ncbi:outer membrane protein transport protein [uncultured Algibacter sp.]|uniref:OmpP1/FadL family transporter n=1 Tax=uncultured Algibacter sp. TaxID=298659 RepID=UPI003217336D
MKKLNLLFIAVFSMSSIYAQDISDALRFSQSEIQGTARFRALSGAFGALGGDLSAVSLNPASSAVFTRSHASVTGSSLGIKNKTQYFDGTNNNNDSDFGINQLGAVFVFESNNSSWRKITLAVNYDKTNGFDENWRAEGLNTNDDGQFSNSIASYFFDFADGLRLDEISARPTESLSDAYFDIGSSFGFANQQAFLGFESFILEPENPGDDANTLYTSNVSSGNFNQDYNYASTGYNGKITFNIAAQYEDNLYIGLNLNSHFISYDRSTLLFENNSNAGSIINNIEFENNLSTVGSGFSFQLGGIMKLSPEFRVGLTYDSPTWYTIEEETSQFLATDGNDSGTNITQIINPNEINIFPRYKIQTPANITGSLAYIFGKQGLISFDYSKKDYSNTKLRPDSDFNDLNDGISDVLTDASTYKIGAEYKHKQLSFRGGYRFEESPYADGVTVGDLNGYSLGIGCNFGNTKLDLTYDQSERSFETPLFNQGLIETANIDRKNSNITLSLSFNL